MEYADHIIQVENSDATYKFSCNRHSVDIPLGVPAPGESTRSIFVKCGCWNTCVGGPGRKRFSLLFTLFRRYIAILFFSKEPIPKLGLMFFICICMYVCISIFTISKNKKLKISSTNFFINIKIFV